MRNGLGMLLAAGFCLASFGWLSGGCTTPKAISSFDSAFFNRGGIRVTSEPAGAEVFINEKRIGRTPVAYGLDSVVYRVVAKKRGLGTAEEWVTVPEGKTIEVKLKFDSSGKD